MSSSDRHTGGCMCGTVRYEARGEPLFVALCHCASCRHHTGAAVATLAVFDSEQVAFTEGTRKLYASSIGENSVHGSDSLENAAIEIAYFFRTTELCPR